MKYIVRYLKEGKFKEIHMESYTTALDYFEEKSETYKVVQLLRVETRVEETILKSVA